MIKVDIISGFLGAGKTTLIKKLYGKVFSKEKVALIENEFGEIGIDSKFLGESGINIKEINSGCICCSLVGSFEDSMKEIVSTYSPDRIIIEPSGVGKLSDIIKAVESVDCGLKLNIVATVADAGKVKMYRKNFGEFYDDQVKKANTIILSKVDKTAQEKIEESFAIIREMNETAMIVTTPITEDNGEKILLSLEDSVNLLEKLFAIIKSEHEHHHHESCCCGHDHEHHHHDEECCCGHDHEHHHHDEECCCGHDHEHHHHDEECCCGHDHEHHHHDEECCCGHDHEHHHHDEECCCGHDHEHHHHADEECCCGNNHEHHHHADEVFASWGKETVKAYSKAELENILSTLALGGVGEILRSKGIVKAKDSNNWYYFDFVAGDWEIREGESDIVGRVVVIGSNLCESEIEKIFLG